VTRAYVSIGSNIDPEHNVRSSVATLRARFGGLLVSPVYRTPAMGFEGEDFLNLVAAFDTGEDCHAVVDALGKIEIQHGRQRTDRKFGSRTLDVDLLLYGNGVVEESTVSLPREEITRFAFVLAPLADIAADLVHPVLGVSIGRLWRDFDRDRNSLVPVALEL
jgi:2-amino-4-hydroxy-6-hydroxymethyldihydropteridine diphosphokinase